MSVICCAQLLILMDCQNMSQRGPDFSMSENAFYLVAPQSFATLLISTGSVHDDLFKGVLECLEYAYS